MDYDKNCYTRSRAVTGDMLRRRITARWLDTWNS